MILRRPSERAPARRPQDEASCVVFGMPKEALQIGAAQSTEALENLPRLITDYARATCRS